MRRSTIDQGEGGASVPVREAALWVRQGYRGLAKNTQRLMLLLGLTNTDNGRALYGGLTGLNAPKTKELSDETSRQSRLRER